ncbi:MAG: hypothetical protein FWE62_02130 [Firmicutes bacterium]|nr:hypothetical protein [Bacillota bacterium]
MAILFKQKKAQFSLCPRCELNYFVPDKKHKYCEVCLAEMGEGDPSILIPDDDEIGAEILCPVCKGNYMLPGEAMCFLCSKEDDGVMESEDAPIAENWADIGFDDPDLDVIPMEMLEEEEAAEDEEYYGEEESVDDFEEEYSDSFYDGVDDEDADDDENAADDDFDDE